MKRLLLASIFCSFVCVLYIQARTNEQPIGQNLTLNRVPVQILEQPDMARIHAEDAIADKQSGPFQVAYGIPVKFTINDSGTWYDLPNGDRLWQLRIHIPNALSLGAFFDKFYLPEGTKFFVYNEETGQSRGAITSEFLTGSFLEPSDFFTGLINGDIIVFEYWQPATIQGTAVLSISYISFGYRDLNNSVGKITPFGVGSADDCHININCIQGRPWQNEKRAIARITIPVGGGRISRCTGALINNTNNDLTPFFLTADHCLNGLDATENNDASNWWFDWGFERVECCNNSPVQWGESTRGATVVANNSITDFALLRLSPTDNPVLHPNVNPYFLGWCRSRNAPTTARAIHHPRGDVKKINIANNITNQSLPMPFENRWLTGNTNWRVTWSSGANEGGSSGSPLLNSFRQVVGQLRGGLSECGQLISWADWYGRFDVSWTGNGASDPRRRLRDWLDPLNTGVTYLGSCQQVVEVRNTTVSRGSRIIESCGDINIENVSVTNNLALNAPGDVRIRGLSTQGNAEITVVASGNVYIEASDIVSGTQLIIYAGGRVRLGVGFRAAPGALSIR